MPLWKKSLARVLSVVLALLALLSLALLAGDLLGRLRGDRLMRLTPLLIALLLLVAVHLGMSAVMLWRTSRRPSMRALRALATTSVVAVVIVLGESLMSGGGWFTPVAVITALLGPPIVALMLLFRIGWQELVAPISSRLPQLRAEDQPSGAAARIKRTDFGRMSPYLRIGALMLLGALAFQGVLSLFSDSADAPVAVVATPPPAPQPAPDNGQRYSVMATDQSKIYLFTGRDPAEARDKRCSGCGVVAEGEGRCGAYLSFFLPWNKPIYAIARSTAEAEERVIRICQLRDASMRDCSGVQSFCSAE